VLSTEVCTLIRWSSQVDANSMSKAYEIVSYVSVLYSADPWVGDLTGPSAIFVNMS
jgi:hypothetical protein